MKAVKKSLFLQHLLMITCLIGLFLGLFYQFSISFANHKYGEVDANLRKTNSIMTSLITYNIKSHDGKISKNSLKSYIENLKILNPTIEQISIFDTASQREIIAIGEEKHIKPYKPVNIEVFENEFVAPSVKLSLLDNLSYKLLGFTYNRILDNADVSLRQPQQLLIANTPVENIQIQTISSYRYFETVYLAYIRSTILAILVCILLILSLYIFTHLKLIAPLHKLKRGALEIAKGNLRHEIKVGGFDEIGIVGTFFNEVARNLRDITSELYEKDRLMGEVNIAAKIQDGLIPAHAPDIPGLDIKLGYKAAAEVGGDSLDFLPLDEKNMLMYIGDVSGHGIPSGLVMTMVDILIHGFSDIYSDLTTMMINLNKHITPKIDASMFMTMLMMNWNHDDQKFQYVGAGHESIIHYKASTREINNIKAGGIAIGMLDDNSQLIQAGELKPEVGDVIILYTDGIPEAWGGEEGKELYGMEKFLDSVKRYSIQSSAELIFESITEDLSHHMGQHKQADDITLMVIKYTGITAHEKNVKLKLEETSTLKKRTGKWNWNK